MTRQIFATVAPTGITIRAALPGEVYGDPLPFSAARLWELERQGQVWTLDVLRGAREHCMGRSFATEYQQIPFDEESARQRDLDEEHHADYRAWLRSRSAPPPDMPPAPNGATMPEESAE